MAIGVAIGVMMLVVVLAYMRRSVVWCQHTVVPHRFAGHYSCK